jgi:hypothetical protein
VNGGVQPSTGNYLGMRFIPASSTGIIRAYNYVMGNYNHIDFNDQAFYIQATGNIGMGNNLPAYKLDITGTTRLSGSLLVGSGNTDTTRMISCLKSTMAGNDKVFITLGRSNDSYNQAEIVFQYVGAASVDNKLVLGLHSNEAMNICADKRVSIGDTGSMRFNILDSVNSPNFRIGRAQSTNNCLTLRWAHIGDGNALNNLAFDFFGSSESFSVSPTCVSVGGTQQANKGRLQIWNPVIQNYSGTMAFYNVATNSASTTTTSPISTGIYCNGNIFCNNWIMALSDRRVKTNIQDIDISDDMFMKLQPKRYNKNGYKKSELGLIAQDIYSIGLLDILDLIPNDKMKKSCEDDPEDGYQWGMQYDKLGVITIPVIQRLINRVDILEEEKWNLSKRVQTLEEDIEEYKVLADDRTDMIHELTERLIVLEQTLKNAKTLKEIRGALE